jgi:nitrous oxidase accessory protein NosD
MMVTEQTPPVRDLQIKNNIFQTQIGVLIHNAEGTAVVNNTFKGRIVTDGTWAAGVQLVTSPNVTVENNLFYDVGNNR